MTAAHWRLSALAGLCLAVVLWVALEQVVPGGLALALGALGTWRSDDPAFRRRMGVLLGAVFWLGFAPIGTSTRNENFLSLGVFFLTAVVVPSLVLARTDPGVVRYRLWPREFSWLELAYVVLSVPLAWAGLRLYFLVSPEVAFNWALPPVAQDDPLVRLFVGINLVGIWDELFFVNVSFAILHSLFPMRIANPAQAVVYTAVLWDMAFRGVGPVFVYAFALTQGLMFRRTENLLYVLVVHLIVDYFLFQEIVTAHYPGFTAWWHPSF